MLTLAIISQKGGAGKTTISLNLAIAAELAGKTAAVIDLDPQASATTIGDLREAENPTIMSVQAVRLPQVLAAAEKSRAELVIIDTAPHSESDSLTAAKVADLVLVPCRPTVLDLQAISRTVNLVELAQVPALVVLNAVPPTGKLGQEGQEAIEQYNLSVAPVRLIHRAAYYHAFTAGLGVLEYQPYSKAADEVKQLYKFIIKHVNMLEKKHEK